MNLQPWGKLGVILELYNNYARDTVPKKLMVRPGKNDKSGKSLCLLFPSKRTLASVLFEAILGHLAMFTI